MHAIMVEHLSFVSKILTAKRHVEDGERSQLENLRWLGMDWDESPETHENYRQSERLDLYQKYIDQLLAEGKAYKSYVYRRRVGS